MSPKNVTWTNRKLIFKQMFPHIRDRINCRLKKNDQVRVALYKGIFAKGSYGITACKFDIFNTETKK